MQKINWTHYIYYSNNDYIPKNNFNYNNYNNFNENKSIINILKIDCYPKSSSNSLFFLETYNKL